MAADNHTNKKADGQTFMVTIADANWACTEFLLATMVPKEIHGCKIQII